MSKAFVKESDAEDDDEEAAPRGLPPGAKNYMRPQSFRALEKELHELLRVERPKIVEIVSWAAANGDRSENGDYIYGKKRLREIDRRVRFLTKRLEGATVVDPALQKNRAQVFFGATVTYIDHHDAERTITIVGVDEADMSNGLVSWISPVAKALLKARVGDSVKVRTPAGEETIDVTAIRYGDG